MIRETRDPHIINYFAAHPDIAPHINGPLDFTDAMRETAIYHFGEHGGLCYEWCAPGTYEVHVMFTPEWRGRKGIEVVRQSLGLLDADHVWARIQELHVALFARWCGFRPAGEITLYTPEPALWHVYSWRKQCPL